MEFKRTEVQFGGVLSRGDDEGDFVGVEEEGLWGVLLEGEGLSCGELVGGREGEKFMF